MSDEPAISYARVSQEDQAKGFSLAQQQADNRRYAEARGLRIVRELADDESGRTVERDDFAELLRILRAGQVKHVVVWALDRLSREPEDFFPLRRELRALGVTIHYSQRGRASSLDDDEEFLEDIEIVLAKREWKKIRARSIGGRWQKARAGFIPNTARPPYGYQAAGTRRTSTYTPHPEYGPIVTQIYTWFHARVPVSEIRRRLIAQGIATPGDRGIAPTKKAAYGEWQDHVIYRLLRQPIYKGQAEQHARTVQNGKNVSRPAEERIIVSVPPLVSEELWETVQQLLDSGRRNSRRNSNPTYLRLLSRRIRCVCGSPVHHRRTGPSGRGKQTYTYYLCSSRSLFKGVCAHTTAFPVAAADAAAWELVVAFVANPDLVLAATFERADAAAAVVASADQEIEQAERRLATAQRKLARTLDLLSDVDPLDQPDTAALLIQQREAQETAVAHARAEARRLAARRDVPERDPRALLAGLKALRPAIMGSLSRPDIPFEEQRGLIEDLEITAELRTEGAGDERQRILALFWYGFPIGERIV